nr:hypothetical protein [Tanacetum cinerariifolium]
CLPLAAADNLGTGAAVVIDVGVAIGGVRESPRIPACIFLAHLQSQGKPERKDISTEHHKQLVELIPWIECQKQTLNRRGKSSKEKGVVRFGKRMKLNPRYVRPFNVLERVGDVAYKLDLPEELSRVHFVEEPVEIMDREVKRLKKSQIPLVK